MKSRNLYFDYLRAIAIMMVVGIHCYNSEYQSDLYLFIRNTLNCAVPLFLAISGFFIGKKELNSCNKFFNFLHIQVPRVYIPMLIWSLPFVSFNLRHGYEILPTFLDFFLGGLGVFYFITLIIQYYLLLPLMTKFIHRFGMGGVLLGFLVSELSIAFMIYLRTVCDMDIPLLLFAGLFPVWIVFYMMGIYLGRLPERNYSPIIPLLIIIAGLVLSQFEASYLFRHYETGFGIKPTSFLYAFGVILFLFSSRVERRTMRILGQSNRFLTYVGNVSFGIYLIHLHFVGRLAQKFSSDWLMRWLIAMAATIIFIQLLLWVVPQKYQKYLGI